MEVSTNYPTTANIEIVEPGSSADPADWWRTWFGPGYLALYDDYLAERTPQEIDQLEALLRLRPPLRVLDLACGQGRHAIELARRGYDVTGLDLSDYLLGVASRRARTAAVGVRWIHGDMREAPAGRAFDLVLNLFTAFGYFAEDADNQRVLDGAAHVLGRGGRMVLEIINGELVFRDFEPRDWYTVGRIAVIEDRRLDRARRRLEVRRTVERDGEQTTDFHSLRLYAAAELTTMLRVAGFARIDVYAGWDGAPLGAQSSRLLAVAGRDG